MHMLRMIKRVTIVMAFAALLATSPSPVASAQQQTLPPQPQTEFVPVDELPQAEQIPAAPLVIGAYSVVWVALFVYLVSIWRRLQKVDRDLADVARRMTERSRT